MAMETLAKNFGRGLSLLYGVGSGRLRNILAELRGYRITVVSGAAAATPITLANITTSDTIQSVIQYATGVPSDITNTVTIPTNGHIQSSANTSGDVLVVHWYSKLNGGE